MTNIQAFVFGDIVLHVDDEIRRLEESVEVSEDEQLEVLCLEMLYGFKKFREKFVDSFIKAEEKN